jgi:uridine kinase
MVIGIGGVSRAGKTTLAYKIREWFGKKTVFILHQDDYTQPEEKLPKIKDHIDWEHPDSLDFSKLKSLLQEYSNRYPLVIVEGLLVFHDQQLMSLLDKRIYIQISKEAFLNRKTLDNRWGDEPDWYIEHIWTSHFNYGLLPLNEKNTLQIDGEACCTDEIVQKFLEIHQKPNS